VVRAVLTRDDECEWAYALRESVQRNWNAVLSSSSGAKYKHVGYTSSEPAMTWRRIYIRAPDPNMRPYMWKCGKKKAGRILNIARGMNPALFAYIHIVRIGETMTIAEAFDVLQDHVKADPEYAELAL